MRTAEQADFAAALHDALSAADVPGAARAWAGGDRTPGEALWRKLAGLGVTALAVPESCGGLAASLLDVVAACEELGHHPVPGPVAESAAVAVLLTALERPDLAQRWLPGLATGELLVTLALPPRSPYAADAAAAGLVLLVDSGGLWLARPGDPQQSVDPARTVSLAYGQQALAQGPAVAAAAARAFDVGALACAAQLLGAGRALLEASVRHATTRVQFGKPIGSFQAVQHQLADVVIGLEFARPLLDAAAESLDAEAVSLDAGEAQAGRDVSAAKVACTDAASRAARTALQVHGAIGYTQEHDLHLWLTKVRALAGAWGSQAWHRSRVMAAIAGDAVWT